MNLRTELAQEASDAEDAGVLDAVVLETLRLMAAVDAGCCAEQTRAVGECAVGASARQADAADRADPEAFARVACADGPRVFSAAGARR